MATPEPPLPAALLIIGVLVLVIGILTTCLVIGGIESRQDHERICTAKGAFTVQASDNSWHCVQEVK